MQQQIVDSVFEGSWIGEIADPHRAAADLVLVGRADAAAGGADLLVAAPLLAGSVESAVRGQDQRRIVGDPQRIGRDFQSLAAHRLDFAEQCPGIDDDAVADDRPLAGPHDSGGQQAELVLDIADDEGMAGIVAALEANHDIRPLGEPIDDLALALVAPLRADDGDIAHTRLLGATARPSRAPPASARLLVEDKRNPAGAPPSPNPARAQAPRR